MRHGFGIRIAMFKSVVRFVRVRRAVVNRMRFIVMSEIIVWLVGHRLFMFIDMDGLVMYGQFSHDRSTVVRHCILLSHPHTVRLLIMMKCLLAEVVLLEAFVEVRSVMLGPESGV